MKNREVGDDTKPHEKIAASKAIMDYIADTDCMALAATHDNELTESGRYEEYHFESCINDRDVSFDYKLHKGTSNKTNAIALLEFLDYPGIIVEKARENAKINRLKA